MHKSLNYILILFLHFSSAAPPVKNGQNEGIAALNWKEGFPGIWQVSTGSPGPHNFIELSGKAPKIEAIENLGSQGFPLARSEIRIQVIDGKAYIRLPLQKGEQIYGLGLNFITIPGPLAAFCKGWRNYSYGASGPADTGMGGRHTLISQGIWKNAGIIYIV